MVSGLVNLLPTDSRIPFIKVRMIAFAVSILLVLGSMGAFFTMGLNFGIDFTGGVSIEAETRGDADLARIRSIVGGLDLGEPQVTTFGADNNVLIRVRPQEGEGLEAEQAQQAASRAVQDALLEAFPDITFQQIEVLGPRVSGELITAGVLAVVVALVLMLIYIWFRFEWQYSVGAVAALTHDVIATIGMFAITQIEFNLSTIAAILTIVGYSMNDTVVVYDRIRENLRKYKKMELKDLLNVSINDTLTRTILTSATTLMALFALWAIGGQALQGFAFAMIWGVMIGTFSSIFVAAPMLMLTNVKRDVSES